MPEEEMILEHLATRTHFRMRCPLCGAGTIGRFQLGKYGKSEFRELMEVETRGGSSIWLGMKNRTNEVIIGTKDVVPTKRRVRNISWRALLMEARAAYIEETSTFGSGPQSGRHGNQFSRSSKGHASTSSRREAFCAVSDGLANQHRGKHRTWRVSVNLGDHQHMRDSSQPRGDRSSNQMLPFRVSSQTCIQ